MTPATFRATLGRLDHSQRSFARLTGVDERTVRRWCAGASPIPRWVEVLVGLLEAAGRG